MGEPLDYHRPPAKPNTQDRDPALHALVLGLLLGVVLALLLGAIAVAGRASIVAVDGPLFRKLLLLTPVWLFAIAYISLARISRTRTRIVAAIICAAVACAVAFGLALFVPSMLYFLLGSAFN